MTPTELLREWSLTRRGHAAWLAQLDDDPLRVIRACCTTLACPQEPREVVEALLAAGEFEAAELLVADDGVRAELGPDLLAAIESRVAQASASACEELTGCLASLVERAVALGVPADVRAIREATARRLPDGQRYLTDLERAVHAAEVARVLGDPRLAAWARPPALTEEAFVAWRDSVREAVERGAFDVARTVLEQGPLEASAPASDELARPRWPHRSEAITEVLEWFFGVGLRPPGFERFMPAAADADAWELLGALRAWCRSDDKADLVVLRAFARVMRCEILRSEIDEDRALVYVSDLSAPCFHAFGRRRWPDGLPVGLDGDRAVVVRTRDHSLRLSFHDLVAVVHDETHRRSRLLAHLGRQLPLAAAFPALLADESARWGASEPIALQARGAPILLIGAPGSGKSTLLRALAAREPGAALLTAGDIDDLPRGVNLLIDAADSLDAAGLRALRGELAFHLMSDSEEPPQVVVAGRPSLLARLRAIGAAKMFNVYELPTPSLAELRAQARMSLGWVGIEAASPGLYDRMASLASGNPSLLIHLCHAVATALDERGVLDRRMDAGLLERAWRSEAFRRKARALLWEPVAGQDGVPELLLAITELAPPGQSVAFDRVVWALEAPNVRYDLAWVRERARELASHGLLHVDGDLIRLPERGIAQLVREWAGEP